MKTPVTIAPEALDFTRLIRSGETVGWAEAPCWISGSRQSLTTGQASNVSPVVAKRQSEISSLRASATVMVLRVPKRLSAERARYHSASALLSETAGSASWLDHAAASPSVAGSGEPLFPSLRATLLRRPRQAGVARHRFDPVEIGLSETNRYQFSNRRVIQHRIRIGA